MASVTSAIDKSIDNKDNVEIKIFILVVDPQHSISKKAKRVN